MSKIYTGTGDQGQTLLGDGQLVSKSDLRIEVLGTLDELNAILGLLHTSQYHLSEIITDLQSDLFCVGAIISRHPEPVDLAEKTRQLERQIDQWQKNLPQLRHFIFPGGCPTAGFLHLARTVCRRAERRLVALADAQPAESAETVITYLNRLSDFLFVLARRVNHQTSRREIIWDS